VTAAQKSGLTLFQGSYPIYSGLGYPSRAFHVKDFGVMTFRPKTKLPRSLRRLARPTVARWPSRQLPGPGMALKTEAMGLAVAVEIPLVICDIQRGGPSTGFADQDRASGLAPGALRPQLRSTHSVLAASTPADCFWVAIEASRIASSTWCQSSFFPTATSQTARNVAYSGAKRNPRFSSEFASDPRSDSFPINVIRNTGPALGSSWNAGARASHRRPEKQDLLEISTTSR